METKQHQQQRNWVVPLLATALLSSLLLSASLLFSSSRALLLSFSPIPNPPFSVELSPPSVTNVSKVRVPRLAYLIAGSAGDGHSIRRTLRALYHPANKYVVHLDMKAAAEERRELAEALRMDPVYRRFGNVIVVKRANLVTYRGATMVSNTLHAAAILLREAGDWNWFINLSASDYPLVTQDDLLYVLSSFPREFNFIEHTGYIGWKEFVRVQPVVVDPALYSSQESELFWMAGPKRTMPTAFKVFMGSAWMMLTRQFIEYCICGWDNLPRTALMYFSNFLSSPEAYFQTVICNAPEFRNTTVNHDLHFISWDTPPKQHPHSLSLANFTAMVNSNAPFARKFARGHPVLDKIDTDLLHRDPETGFVPGGWFDLLRRNASETDRGYFVKDLAELRPGDGAERFRKLVTGLINQEGFDHKHCL